MNMRIINRQKLISSVLSVCILFGILLSCGCGSGGGYSSESLYPEHVTTVYVKMFDNQSLRRGIEYKLSEAVAKRIEAETPYKIVSSMDRADTVISGFITSAGETVLTTERQTGRPLEKEVELRAVVNWKNLKTGEFLIENQSVSAFADYSQWMNQSFDYASASAAGILAEKIVQMMEKKW